VSRPARWILPERADDAARVLSRQLGVTPLVARILTARGYSDPDSAAAFLNPALDGLHDPFALLGMDRAVARIREAIASGERILLYGDYDVDGTTSIVILKKALELAGATADFHVPHRVRDGYGMRPEVVESAAAAGVRLIISVDTGIRANAVVEHARALGIDVIVTDHHLPDAELPPALAVLNPNQTGCAYPEKGLCGAGVAFKLVQGLMRGLEWPDARQRSLSESFLKMVAIATVADVVPLAGENRIIVKHGLAGLGGVRNPGLRALMRVAGFQEGASPTAGQVAFRIAPRINAAGRMANAADVVEMFLTNDARRAGELAQRLHELNAERQQTEATTLEACLAREVTDAEAALVFAGDGWHKGVVGIVASRLVERYGRPVFVLAVNEETGEASGSGRSIDGFHLLEALESMHGLFTKFGGHTMAAGVTLDATRVEEFRERFHGFAAQRLTAEDFQPRLRIDAEAELRELTDAAAAEALSLGPFGEGNRAPILAAYGVEIFEPPVPMKEKHLRFRVSQGSKALTMKAWNFASRAGDFVPGKKHDVAFHIEDDAYSAARGYAPWSATLKDIRRSE
jgi:single-stranded-DNA-specific exonuclease